MISNPASQPSETNRFERTKIKEAVIEIVSDSGEGAQKCGQSLGAISAKMGNGVWTVELFRQKSNLQPDPKQVHLESG